MLTKKEIGLWLFSVTIIILSFIVFKNDDYFNLITTLIGVTGLMFLAIGNYMSQVMVIIFSLMYGYISFKNRYYGELITYVFMTLPMAVLALYSWIKNPAKNSKEVAIYKINKIDVLKTIIYSLIATFIFYFILKYFNTERLILSTVSIFTTFSAVYLTYRRSPYYALCYAFNDLVLILLWSLAAQNDVNLISIVVCFIIFLINDIYGLISWKIRLKKQENEMV